MRLHSIAVYARFVQRKKNSSYQNVHILIVANGNNNTIVIACGGGGVPVVKTKTEGYEGVDAVIDKDRSSALLAKEIKADKLIILTAVDKVAINFGKENEKWLDKMSLTEAKVAMNNNEFGEGSMLPKIEATMDFVKSTGNNAIITSLTKAKDALEGKTGTIIYKPEKKEIKEGENMKKKRASLSISAFTIILILIFVLDIFTHILYINLMC